MRMSLMFGSVAGYVALWFGDGDDSCLAAQDPVLLVPLGMRGVLRAVVPASLALGAASLSRQLYRAVVHLPALVRATPTLHKAVLENFKNLLYKGKYCLHQFCCRVVDYYEIRVSRQSKYVCIYRYLVVLSMCKRIKKK